MATTQHNRTLRAPVASMLARHRVHSQVSQQPRYAVAATANNIDLATTDAETPRFVIRRAPPKHATLRVMRCGEPTSICIALKRWLLTSIGADALMQNPRLLRVDCQEIDRLDHRAEATIVEILDTVTMELYIGGQKKSYNIHVLALLVKHDPRIRWFYSVDPISSALKHLKDANILRQITVAQPGSQKYERLFTFLTNQFLHDIAIPHHPDYLNAVATTDYAPTIDLSAKEAMARIECNEFLHDNPARDGGKDLSSDRYLFEIHESERWLASEIELCCAEYMLLKRLFFRDFGVECIRNREKLRPPLSAVRGNSSEQPLSAAEQASQHAGSRQGRGGGGARRDRVRTDRAHLMWMKEHMEKLRWTEVKCRKLITGWKVLGLLDEAKYLHWADQGGMLESSGVEATAEVG